MSYSAQGGKVSAPIWAAFMQQAVPIQRKAGRPLPPPTPKFYTAKPTGDAKERAAERAACRGGRAQTAAVKSPSARRRWVRAT
jgi:membrane carboxypeptidase/penicillin-binding protein